MILLKRSCLALHHPKYSAPIHIDRQLRGHDHTEDEFRNTARNLLPSREPATEKRIQLPHHLQVLEDEEVQAKIDTLIPQMENWLDGTLPLPKENEIMPGNPGVVIPTAGIDLPLTPVRDLLYRGVCQCQIDCR